LFQEKAEIHSILRFSTSKISIEESDAKRESRWTESIAVGGSPFIERIKKAMGAMAKGRRVQPGEGAFELREAQSVYNAIFDHQNRDLDPK